MPIGHAYEKYFDLGPWVRQYERAFLAKGCSPRKARELACEKARKKLREGKIAP